MLLNKLACVVEWMRLRGLEGAEVLVRSGSPRMARLRDWLRQRAM